MEIFQALTAGKNAVDGLRLLANYAEEVKDIQKRGEFMRIVGELSLELAETQIKLADKFRENEGLKERVNKLQKELEDLKNLEIKLVIENGMYYTTEGDGPFCTACYDSNQQRIRVALTPPPMAQLGRYKCPVCKTYFNGR